MKIADSVRMSVKFARNSGHSAVWCQMMTRKFPNTGDYEEWAVHDWREAWDHLARAKKTKKELAA